jgi:PIN domain nuclease of toxin-antitoxin system
MKLLLDTQAFLWWVMDEAALSSRARQLIQDGASVLYLSAASAWEISIKASLGKLKLSDEPGKVITEQMAANGIHPLPIQVSHALHVYSLPPHHGDPFDRMLVAQSQLEDLPIVTPDEQIARYGVRTVW